MKKGGMNYLASLVFADFIITLASEMLAPIYAFFIGNVGGGILDAGVTFFAFSVAGGITTILSGKFLDSHRKHAKHIVVAGYSMISLSFLMLMFARNVWHVILIQILNGFASAFYLPAFDFISSHHMDRKNEGVEWGVWESEDYFASALGSLIGSAIVSFLGFQTLFLMISALSLFSAVFVFLFL